MKSKEERKQDFIRRAMEVHDGENIDYSQVEYKDNRTPVKLIDPEFGEFWQTPSNHLKGQRHPKRKGNRISATKQMTTEEWIRRAKEVHKGEKLDYSKVVYKGAHEKVCIISHELRPDGTEYGEFWQEANAHLRGCSHPEHGLVKQHEAARLTEEEFLSKAKLIHQEDDYDYSHVGYRTYRDNICVCCNKIDRKGNAHGDFLISAENFLAGKGCPKCGNHLSYGEDEIADYIGTLTGVENVLRHDRSVLGGPELDIYIPSYQIAVEFDGLRWHSERFNKGRNYHLDKTLKCREKGVTLYHIFEDEWKFRKDIVLSKIRHILGGDKDLEKVPARKCEVRVIDKPAAEMFLETNHIQGFTDASEHLGAYYQGRLVAVMSLKREHGDGKWSLVRFATDIGLLCQGMAGKLLTAFLRGHSGDVSEVKTFLDRRWAGDENDNLYTKLGFSIDGHVRPDYRYTNGHGERMHKFGFRKQILHRKYGLPLELTETQMTEKLGYYKIWDCGLIRYVLRP